MTRRQKQNRAKFGNIRKRGQEMGYSPREKQRGMKAEGKEGGRHTETKREGREARGGR